jgi:hypothetical protein
VIASTAWTCEILAWAGFVVGDGFEIVGTAKKRSELGAETRIIFDERAKLGLYAVVGFDDSVAALENEGLGRMITREVRHAAGDIGKTDAQNHFGLLEKCARFFKKRVGLRFHNSRP